MSNTRFKRLNMTGEPINVVNATNERFCAIYLSSSFIA